MPAVSWSRIKLWRRCHKAYDYKYNQHLARKSPKPPLLKGSILHEMLDARAKKFDPYKVLQSYAAEYKTLFIEEQELYGDIIEDLRRVFQGYEAEYANEPYTVLSSEEFVATDLSNGLRFVGYIDKRLTDNHGRMWIADHKTSRNIPGVEARYSDYQLLMYVWVYNREHKSEKVSGVLWDYVRTKPPTIPEPLKKGGLSIAKNITTDYRTFMAAIEDHGLDPETYAERLTELKNQVSPFYQRVTLPNPPASMVDQVVTDFTNSAIEAINLSGISTVRNMTRDCQSCDFRSLCDAELRGHDSKFVRKSEYIIREPNDHGDEEDAIDD